MNNELETLRAIVLDLASCNPEQYDSWQGQSGAGLLCTLCHAIGWEKDIPTNVPMPIDMHKPSCPYRRAVEIKNGG